MAQVLDLGSVIGPQGPKGDKGDKGDTGAAGADGKTPTFSINDSGHLIATYPD